MGKTFRKSLDDLVGAVWQNVAGFWPERRQCHEWVGVTPELRMVLRANRNEFLSGGPQDALPFQKKAGPNSTPPEIRKSATQAAVLRGFCRLC